MKTSASQHTTGLLFLKSVEIILYFHHSPRSSKEKDVGMFKLDKHCHEGGGGDGGPFPKYDHSC